MFDDGKKSVEQRGVTRGPSRIGIARVQVQDRRARLGGADRLRRDVFRPVGQRVRHGRRVNGEPVIAQLTITLFAERFFSTMSFLLQEPKPAPPLL